MARRNIERALLQAAERAAAQQQRMIAETEKDAQTDESPSNGPKIAARMTVVSTPVVAQCADEAPA
jgi:hypothetical protein